METQALGLGHLLDEDNHSVCLVSNSSRLFILAFWAVYLLALRFLAAIIHGVCAIPASLHTHMVRVETRIVNIAISIVQLVPGETVAGKYRRRCSRDESFAEGSASPMGPADDLIAPRSSSLDSSGIPEMFLHQPETAYIRPQAPRPPFRRHLENVRPQIDPWAQHFQSAVINPRRNPRRNFGSFDGTVSPPPHPHRLPPAPRPAFVEPIPQALIPPIPTFLARMPFPSVSDSIYSSCSTQQQQQLQQPDSVSHGNGPANSSSSLERNPSTEVQTYTDLLPRRSFDDDSHAHAHAPSNSNTASFPSRIRQDVSLNHNNNNNTTLATMAQHYARMNHRRGGRSGRSIRSLSAPIIPRASTRESKL